MIEIEVIIGICLVITGAGFIGQKIIIKKVEENWKHLPDAGPYRTTTTFKETAITTKGVMGVKMKEPMKYSTKLCLIIIWNSLFISGLTLTDGFFWPLWSSNFALAAIFTTFILSIGSIGTSLVLLNK